MKSELEFAGDAHIMTSFEEQHAPCRLTLVLSNFFPSEEFFMKSEIELVGDAHIMTFLKEQHTPCKLAFYPTFFSIYLPIIYHVF